MTRGAAFLSARAEMLGLPPLPQEQGRRARLIGNVLRELDHFLNILVQTTLGGADGRGQPDQRNTARRLRTLRDDLPLPDSSYTRLRALGRSRACLFHCSGLVRRADARGGTWMTAGWSSDGHILDRVSLGATLSPTPAHLIDTSRFYDGLALDLVSLRPLPNSAALA